MTDIHEAVRPLLEATARNVHSRFPTLDIEDIVSVGWEYVFGNRYTVNEYLSETEAGLAYLGNRIKRAMTQWCSREMRALTGIDIRDTYTYTTKVVRELMKDVFFHENWQSGQLANDGLPKAKGLVNEGGNRVAMLADVSRVLPQLSTDDYNALVWRYKYFMTYEMLGAELGISHKAAASRVQRAVGRMVRLLNREDMEEAGGPPQYTGARRSISNAAARARTADSY